MYTARFTSDFESDTKFLKKDKNMHERVEKKILEILENPEHYKPAKFLERKRKSPHWPLCSNLRNRRKFHNISPLFAT